MPNSVSGLPGVAYFSGTLFSPTKRLQTLCILTPSLAPGHPNQFDWFLVLVSILFGRNESFWYGRNESINVPKINQLEDMHKIINM